LRWCQRRYAGAAGIALVPAASAVPLTYAAHSCRDSFQHNSFGFLIRKHYLNKRGNHEGYIKTHLGGLAIGKALKLRSLTFMNSHIFRNANLKIFLRSKDDDLFDVARYGDLNKQIGEN